MGLKMEKYQYYKYIYPLCDTKNGSWSPKLVSDMWWWLSPHLQGFWRECLTIHSQPALFFLYIKVEISSHTQIPLFMLGSVHSSSASWYDCGWKFPDILELVLDRWSCCTTMPWQRHSNFVGSWVSACLGVTCPLHFWQNNRSLLHATAVTWGWNRHWITIITQS